MSIPPFDTPPLIEVATGIAFSPIPRFTVGHYGIFWSLMRKEFPGFRQLPELSQYEDDEEKASIRIVDLPGLRVALISEDDTEVIQLQSDRFIFNWRTGENTRSVSRSCSCSRTIRIAILSNSDLSCFPRTWSSRQRIDWK